MSCCVSVENAVSSRSVLLNLLTTGIDTNWGYKLKDCLAQPTVEVQLIVQLGRWLVYCKNWCCCMCLSLRPGIIPDIWAVVAVQERFWAPFSFRDELKSSQGQCSVQITWKPEYAGPPHLFSLPHGAHAVAENLGTQGPHTYFSVIRLLGQCGCPVVGVLTEVLPAGILTLK